MSNYFDNIPAATPPNGVTPNFVDPPTQEPAIVTLECVFVSLMLIFVGMRIFVRVTVTKSWGWDDYTCILAACGSIVHMVDYTQMFTVGFGRHLWDIRASTLINTHNTRLLTSNGIAYPFTIFFAKLSVLLLYLRVFDVDTILRYLIWFGIVFQALFYSAFLGIGIGQIVECYGLSQLTKQFCVNVAGPVVLMGASVNVATDFYVLILPIRRVLTLHVRLRYKLGLLVVFSAGLAACAASLARLIVFSTHHTDSDVLWVQASNAQFTVVEINIAIMVACSSCFPAFLTKMRVFSSTFYRSLRTRLSGSRSTYSDISDPSRRQETNGSEINSKNKPADAEPWHGDQVKLRTLNDLDFRDKDKYGATNTVVGGRNNSSISRLTNDDVAMEENELGIVRAVRYDVESR